MGITNMHRAPGNVLARRGSIPFDLDVGRFDDRPPLLDLGLVECTERGCVCCSRVAITWPRSVKCCRTAGSAKVSTTAPLSLMITSLGVPFVTHNPCQNEMYMPGAPISSVVGTSGKDGQRVCAMTANAFILPPRT